MNKWFYIVTLVAAAALAGCTKSEVTAPASKAVSFQVGSYAPQTKADDPEPASIITVDGITSFKSRGYLHAEGVETPQPFFGENGETITYNGTDAWLPSHDYYWPKSANSYVNFISWVGGEPDINYSATDGATFKWDYRGEGKTVSVTDNLLWADMVWRFNSNQVKPDANGYWFDNVTEGVPTLFHHALAQIRVRARTTKESETGITWKVYLRYLQVLGVKNQGIFSMSNTDLGSTGTQPWTIVSAWPEEELDGEATDILAQRLDNPLTLTTEAKDVIDWSNVIPQSVEGKNLVLYFTVETNYDNGTRVVSENVLLEDVSLEDATVTSWDMNTRITYTLVINPDTGVITIIPVEEDWVENSEYPINIE